MKNIHIPLLDSPDALEGQKMHAVDILNWDEYPYQPEVKFKIGRTKHALLIHFYVQEQSVRAVNTEPNQPVYQDSCVEFFVQPVSDGPYMNFEFNAIGTCLSQIGKDRSSREFLPADKIREIITISSLGTEPFEERKDISKWDLQVEIPLTFLFGEKEPDLTGKHIRGNFYKCGDKLSEPHYLSWNAIEVDHPDFHRPEFFGVLEFQR